MFKGKFRYTLILNLNIQHLYIDKKKSIQKSLKNPCDSDDRNSQNN